MVAYHAILLRCPDIDTFFNFRIYREQLSYTLLQSFLPLHSYNTRSQAQTASRPSSSLSSITPPDKTDKNITHDDESQTTCNTDFELVTTPSTSHEHLTPKHTNPGDHAPTTPLSSDTPQLPATPSVAFQGHQPIVDLVTPQNIRDTSSLNHFSDDSNMSFPDDDQHFELCCLLDILRSDCSGAFISFV